MPIRNCMLDGKPGFKWGKQGKCFTYDPSGDVIKRRRAMRAAKEKALAQGRAIQVSKNY
jgi:hypothetical protein